MCVVFILVLHSVVCCIHTCAAFIRALHSYVCCIRMCAAFIFNTYSYVCCIHMCAAFICVLHSREFRHLGGNVDESTALRSVLQHIGATLPCSGMSLCVHIQMVYAWASG